MKQVKQTNSIEWNGKYPLLHELDIRKQSFMLKELERVISPKE